jgi:hypothetical protein
MDEIMVKFSKVEKIEVHGGMRCYDCKHPHKTGKNWTQTGKNNKEILSAYKI